MKIIRILNISFKDAFKSVFRNFSLSMASVSCTAITLILVSLALLVTYNVNSITKDIEDVLTIVAFIDNKATDADVESLKNEIDVLSNVETNVYNSKDSIKEELSKDEDLKQILETLDENPVQSTFVINVKDVRIMKTKLSHLQKEQKRLKKLIK